MTESIPTGVIKEFRGEYAFLSNFYTGPFYWRGWSFVTVEHAFQATKMYHMKDANINDMRGHLEKIQACTEPAKAKYWGRAVKIDVDTWDAQKVQYMREIIHAKFHDVPGLAGKLVNTGAMLLVEGNDWQDYFWGRCNGKGLNTLGTILMEERGYWLHSDFNDKKEK